jgi:hypothetical protein
LRSAAILFREVLDGGWTNYPVGYNYVQYNPSTSCGGSVINIENKATSALYRYTPYQPNSGSLAAGYGTASCGSYGNRNFYLYFMDWFGDPTSDNGSSSLAYENELILKKYSDFSEILGESTGNIGHNSSVNSYWRKFENGYIVGNSSKGYYISMGAMRRVWQDNGFESGRMGFPQSDIETDETGVRMQRYENGYVVYGTEEGGYELLHR